MEPRPFSRGNQPVHSQHSPTSRVLQWSRGLSAAETVAAAVDARARLVLQWSRGLSAAETGTTYPGPTAPKDASMEPRPFSRGNVVHVGQVGELDLLQWSRGLSAAETCAPLGTA